jgi:hypothetical protein
MRAWHSSLFNCFADQNIMTMNKAKPIGSYPSRSSNFETNCLLNQSSQNYAKRTETVWIIQCKSITTIAKNSKYDYICVQNTKKKKNHTKTALQGAVALICNLSWSGGWRFETSLGKKSVRTHLTNLVGHGGTHR